jgi:hypothetical protein
MTLMQRANDDSKATLNRDLEKVLLDILLSCLSVFRAKFLMLNSLAKSALNAPSKRLRRCKPHWKPVHSKIKH